VGSEAAESDSARSAHLRDAVLEAYTAAAVAPNDRHPFPIGRDFAHSLGYPAADLATLPTIAVDAFTGVSNVSIFADLRPGMRILDLGCGAGLDSLIAARRVGRRGRVIGLDFSTAMLRRAREAAVESETGNVTFCQASAESLPLKDGVIDAVLINGIFNLNPARRTIFAELARVIRTEGSIFAAELILREPLPPEIRASEKDWFA
jgi:SAM-dependent methyltransferase